VVHNDYASLPHKKELPEGHAPVIRMLAVPVFRHDLMVAVMGVGGTRNPIIPNRILKLFFFWPISPGLSSPHTRLRRPRKE
jgi:hypothetical protein